MTAEAVADLGRYHENIKTLCAIALRRLPQMIDEATGLMVFHSQDDALGESIVSSGSSFRYSAAAALGIERAEQYGLAPTLDLERLVDLAVGLGIGRLLDRLALGGLVDRVEVDDGELLAGRGLVELLGRARKVLVERVVDLGALLVFGTEVQVVAGRSGHSCRVPCSVGGAAVPP